MPEGEGRHHAGHNQRRPSTISWGGWGDDRHRRLRNVEAGAAQPGQARSFGALKQIDSGVLNIGYAEVGPTAGCECRTASREEESRKGVIEEH